MKENERRSVARVRDKWKKKKVCLNERKKKSKELTKEGKEERRRVERNMKEGRNLENQSSNVKILE